MKWQYDVHPHTIPDILPILERPELHPGESKNLTETND